MKPRVVIALVAYWHVVSSLAAQPTNQPSGAETAAGCMGCGFILMIPVAIFLVNICLLIWVAKDAKARGMDSSVLWMILVMITSFVGLIIYVFSRPKGDLVACRHCGNYRLTASATCPHCGNA